MFKKYQLRSYNFRLVILVIVATVFGIAVINSANSDYTLRQCFGFALSLAVMIFVSFVDYNWIMKFYWLGYIICIGMLLAVELFGKTANNAQRWLDLGPVQIQPSELSKIILIVFTAKLISVYKEKLNTWKFLVVLAILCAIPLFLILMQPSLSTTLVIVLILLTIIYCSGLSYKIIGTVLAVMIPLSIGMILYISNPNQILLKDYQRNRIMTFFNPEENEAGAYQQEYSEKAIGSGQLTGKGLGTDDPSSLKNTGYIAEAQTDFIFAVIGEELGFVGGCFVIILLSAIVIECIIAAVRAKDFAGRLICCGVAGYIAFQSFINIGVATRVLPNTGQPLPFISYGLTSLLTLYIAVGIVLNVGLQRKIERDDDIFAEDFRG